MKRQLIGGLALLVGVLSFSSIGLAQERGEWGRRMGGHRGFGTGPRLMALLENDQVKASLGLSDQQSERLHQIMVDARKSSIKSRAELALRGIELRELLRSDRPDRDAVMKKVQEISDLRRGVMMQHVDVLLASKTVLTPEQQTKIRNFLRHRRAGFGPRQLGERRFQRLERPGTPAGPPPLPAEPPVQ